MMSFKKFGPRPKIFRLLCSLSFLGLPFIPQSSWAQNEIQDIITYLLSETTGEKIVISAGKGAMIDQFDYFQSSSGRELAALIESGPRGDVVIFDITDKKQVLKISKEELYIRTVGSDRHYYGQNDYVPRFYENGEGVTLTLVWDKSKYPFREEISSTEINLSTRKMEQVKAPKTVLTQLIQRDGTRLLLASPTTSSSDTITNTLSLHVGGLPIVGVTDEMPLNLEIKKGPAQKEINFSVKVHVPSVNAMPTELSGLELIETAPGKALLVVEFQYFLVPPKENRDLVADLIHAEKFFDLSAKEPSFDNINDTKRYAVLKKKDFNLFEESYLATHDNPRVKKNQRFVSQYYAIDTVTGNVRRLTESEPYVTDSP